ncbi:MAG: hypothetical protein ACI9VS_001614 [Candidatus Binatia bacterium]|jgi:hypothetical protein
MKKSWKAMIAAVLGLLFNVGCATYTKQSADMMAKWEAGNALGAAVEFGEKAVKSKDNKDSVIWNLEAGAAYRAAGEYETSNRFLDAAADRIDRHEEKANIEVGKEAGALMTNQQNLPYKGKSYDKIMLHTYKAMNYLAMGDIDRARPEIIRAYQRQTDAVDDNKRRIEKAMEAEEESKEKEKIEKARQDAKFAESLDSVTSDLEGFKFYADYVNPFTVYLDALFFLHAGGTGSDLERANKSFDRIVETAGDNRFIQEDLQVIQAALQGASPKPCTYVIFETGRAASLDQIRIDIPIIIAKVSYVGAAFPKLKLHPNYTPVLMIRAGGVDYETEIVASMDSMVALDFKNEFPVIVTKTLISTVAKATAAYLVNDAAAQQDALVGLFSKIATAAAQAAVNIADTRSWNTLPKEFQVARFETPEDRTVTIGVGSGGSVELQIIDGGVNIVHVQAVNATSPLIVNQYILK